MEIEIVNKILNHWQENGIFSKSSTNLLNKSLQENHIMMPIDFLELYQISNGTTDYDNEGFLFYKYENLITMGNKFSLKDNNPLKDVVLFIDYMQESWWYGFRIKADGYEIGIISEADKFKKISNSLSTFLNLYFYDSPDLYEYN